MKLYGGFKGGETMLSQRNIWTNPTILSGDIGVSGDNSDNSYHVVSASGNMTTVNTVLDGFRIEDGYADNGSGGAGILLQNGASPLITHCIFSNNHTSGNGGAIAFAGTATAPRFEYCLFDGNTAVNGGVAYLSTSDRDLSFHRSIFVNNTASSAGAVLYATDAAVATADSSLFWNNTASGILQSLASDQGNISISFSAVDDETLPGTLNEIKFYTSTQEDGPFTNLIDYIVDSEHKIPFNYGYRNGTYVPPVWILNIKVLLQGAL